MNYNDILRSTRYILNLTDTEMMDIFGLAGLAIGQSQLTALLKKETDPGYASCSSRTLASFFDGLIVHKRGRKETLSQAHQPQSRLANNDVLKKLRIALELKEDDMLGIMKLAGVSVSKPELSALFRKQGHKNYKECGDQFLRNFLKGLAIRCRSGGHS